MTGSMGATAPPYPGAGIRRAYWFECTYTIEVNFMGENDFILEARDLRKQFGGLLAVDSVSLNVTRGSTHAIIGPNGAGKTTFFNLLTGLMQPDAGRIVLDGGDVTGMTPWRLVRRGVGRSFQQTNLFWTLFSLID